MSTTVHIPPALLTAVDRRARALRISRNRLIVRSLERELGEPTGWSPEFIAHLERPLDPGVDRAAEELLDAITRHRRSKRPPRL